MSATSLDPSGASASRIDVRQLKALLRAYVVLSTRSMPVGLTGAKRVRTLPFVLAIYGFLGFILAAMAPLLPSTFFFALFVHTMSFFIVGTMALNEASEVLYNARDADILGGEHHDLPARSVEFGEIGLGQAAGDGLCGHLRPENEIDGA